jgi:membrane associated rhomboid family serine protease
VTVTWLPLAVDLPPRTAAEWALVLEAVGIPQEVRSTAGGGQLWVPEDRLEAAVGELSRYLRENHAPPEARLAWPHHSHSLAGIAGYAAVLLAVTGAALERVGDVNWVNRGVLDAGFAARGEWWRPFTALTLHADLGHLLANLAFGAIFAWPAGQLFGPGVAWLLIVVGAAGAYALDALLHPPSHALLGASTAVFTALGLTAAVAWRRRATFRITPMQRAAPLVAGVALLAFTGLGGERTDVLAHVLGFMVGGLIGAAAAGLPWPAPGRRGAQWAAGAAALALVAGAWYVALTSTA